MAGGQGFDRQEHLSCRNESVLPKGHGRCAGMVGLASDPNRESALPHHTFHNSDGNPTGLEDRTLLHMQFKEDSDRIVITTCRGKRRPMPPNAFQIDGDGITVAGDVSAASELAVPAIPLRPTMVDSSSAKAITSRG